MAEAAAGEAVPPALRVRELSGAAVVEAAGETRGRVKLVCGGGGIKSGLLEALQCRRSNMVRFNRLHSCRNLTMTS